MRFANPQMLWLLLAVPILIVGLALRYGWRRRLTAKLGHLPQLAALTDGISHGRRLAKNILLVLSVALFIFTFSRPQAGERSTLAPAVGIDIVVALDFSKSMLAKDAYPTRLARAKAELGRLVDSLRGDRLGLVAFAGDTMTYPLTTDYQAAKLFWRDIEPSDMPVGGTAIGKALTAATRLLSGGRGDSQPRSQIILLLTDGEDHESEPLQAAKEAAKQGIRIFAVGIGSRSGEPVPDINEQGQAAGYVKDDQGSFVTTRLDEKMLSDLAETTNGSYLIIEPGQFAVEPILSKLTQMKKSESQARLVKHYDEAYLWFLVPGLILLFAEVLLSERKQSRRKSDARA